MVESVRGLCLLVAHRWVVALSDPRWKRREIEVHASNLVSKHHHHHHNHAHKEMMQQNEETDSGHHAAHHHHTRHLGMKDSGDSHHHAAHKHRRHHHGHETENETDPMARALGLMAERGSGMEFDDLEDEDSANSLRPRDRDDVQECTTLLSATGGGLRLTPGATAAAAHKPVLDRQARVYSGAKHVRAHTEEKREQHKRAVNICLDGDGDGGGTAIDITDHQGHAFEYHEFNQQNAVDAATTLTAAEREQMDAANYLGDQYFAPEHVPEDKFVSAREAIEKHGFNAGGGGSAGHTDAVRFAKAGVGVVHEFRKHTAASHAEHVQHLDRRNYDARYRGQRCREEDVTGVTKKNQYRNSLAAGQELVEKRLLQTRNAEREQAQGSHLMQQLDGQGTGQDTSSVCRNAESVSDAALDQEVVDVTRGLKGPKINMLWGGLKVDQESDMEYWRRELEKEVEDDDGVVDVNGHDPSNAGWCMKVFKLIDVNNDLRIGHPEMQNFVRKHPRHAKKLGFPECPRDGIPLNPTHPIRIAYRRRFAKMTLSDPKSISQAEFLGFFGHGSLGTTDSRLAIVADEEAKIKGWFQELTGGQKDKNTLHSHAWAANEKTQKKITFLTRKKLRA